MKNTLTTTDQEIKMLWNNNKKKLGELGEKKLKIKCLESQKAGVGVGRGCGESKNSKMYPHAPIKPLLNQVGSKSIYNFCNSGWYWERPQRSPGPQKYLRN